jgi:hypothetical protein
MVKIALRIGFGLCLLCAAIYLLLDSNFLDYLEGTNLDGSNSITWRSGVALLLLAGLTQRISFWTFRRRLAPRVIVGIGLCIAVAILLFESSFAFRREPRDANGIGPITWRSDLVILALITITQGISFWFFRLIKPWKRNHPEAGALKQPTI